MITTTQFPTDRKPAAPAGSRHRGTGGFTMVELMIASSLSSFVLAGILSSFLFIGRSGMNAMNYNDMEGQARKALEVFAEDTRQASAITWNSSTSVTLIVNTQPVVYVYDSGSHTFSRAVSVAGTLTSKALVNGIVTFKFVPYSISAQVLPLTSSAELTAASARTKQLQISLQASRTNRTVVAATNTVLSARFILRNKIVTT